MIPDDQEGLSGRVTLSRPAKPFRNQGNVIERMDHRKGQFAPVNAQPTRHHGPHETFQQHHRNQQHSAELIRSAGKGDSKKSEIILKNIAFNPPCIENSVPGLQQSRSIHCRTGFPHAWHVKPG
ncbi:MAG: hypothetical protein Q4G00_06605 [Clostridia bacterium]|nr:hypothetical protein [Clostridia bacterium]